MPKRYACDLPTIMCPHCDGEFDDESVTAEQRTITCVCCGKTIYVTHALIQVTLSLSTEPDRK